MNVLIVNNWLKHIIVHNILVSILYTIFTQHMFNDMISIFDLAVCGYTLAYCWYDIDVGTPCAILEASGKFLKGWILSKFPFSISAPVRNQPLSLRTYFDNVGTWFQVENCPKCNFLIPQPIFTKFDINFTLWKRILKMYLIQVQVCPEHNFLIPRQIFTKFDSNPSLCQPILKIYLIQESIAQWRKEFLLE